MASSVLARLDTLRETLHLENLQPIPAGHQNLVFSCLIQGEPGVLKVADSRHRSRSALETQFVMLNALKHHAPHICAPLRLANDSPIVELDVEGIPFHIVAYPHVTGESAQVGRHSHRMGKALAELHGAMRQLPGYAFGQIATTDSLMKTRDAARIWGVAEQDHEAMVRHHSSNGVQLLHGDYNVDNLKINGAAVDILDFDNCGYGSPMYELANSLYMVLFDQIVHKGGDLAPYHDFRQDFLEGYRGSSPNPIEETAIDAFLDYRVLSLSSWLRHPVSAPLFVRQSTDAWLNTLRMFVQLYFTSLRGELNRVR